MQPIHVHVIGLAAGICTTISFAPQIIKILKTRHARDISLLMFVVLSTGIFLWLVYGILLGALPVILANGMSLILCVLIIVLRLKFKGGAS